MLSCHLATVPVRSKKEISNPAILGFTFLPGVFPVLSLVITQSGRVVTLLTALHATPRCHYMCVAASQTVQCTGLHSALWYRVSEIIRKSRHSDIWAGFIVVAAGTCVAVSHLYGARSKIKLVRSVVKLTTATSWLAQSRQSRLSLADWRLVIGSLLSYWPVGPPHLGEQERLQFGWSKLLGENWFDRALFTN